MEDLIAVPNLNLSKRYCCTAREVTDLAKMFVCMARLATDLAKMFGCMAREVAYLLAP